MNFPKIPQLALPIISFLAAVFPTLAANATVEPAKLTEHIYKIDGTMANSVFLDGKDGVLLIDSGDTDEVGAQIKAAIASVTDKPVEYLINTHAHFDHVSGNTVFGGAGTSIFGQDNMRKTLATEALHQGEALLPPSALPVMTITNSITMFFDDEVIWIHHPDIGNAHTNGDLLVYFRIANVIHMGDLFFNHMYPYIDVEHGGNLAGIVSACNEALEYIGKDTIVVPGHGAIADKKTLADYVHKLDKVNQRIERMVRNGMTLKEVQAAKPTAELGESWEWGQGAMTADVFVGLVYEGIINNAN